MSFLLKFPHFGSILGIFVETITRHKTTDNESYLGGWEHQVTQQNFKIYLGTTLHTSTQPDPNILWKYSSLATKTHLWHINSIPSSDCIHTSYKDFLEK